MSIITTTETLINNLFSGDLLGEQLTRAVTYTKVSNGSYNPATGKTTTIETNYTILVIIKNASSERKKDYGVLALTDYIIYAKDLNYTLLNDYTKDYITLYGKKYSIVKVSEYSLSDTKIVFRLEVKGI